MATLKKALTTDNHCRRPARLLGLEGADNTDMGDYRDNRQRVYNGRLLAYIQTTGEAGEINVSFSSPLLKGAEIKFTAE